MAKYTIVTTFVYPPIPFRGADWQATLADFDGAPDASGPCTKGGHGATEAEAVADLIEQLSECDYDESK